MCKINLLLDGVAKVLPLVATDTGQKTFFRLQNNIINCVLIGLPLVVTSDVSYIVCGRALLGYIFVGITLQFHNIITSSDIISSLRSFTAACFNKRNTDLPL
jgi:hypothetical protein